MTSAFLPVTMFTVLLSSSTCEERHPDQNTSLVEDFEYSMAQLRHIAYEILGPTLIVTGILGNILNLIVLARPFLNDCTRIYLRALAIADLNVLIFEIPTIVRLNHLQGETLKIAIYHAHFELVLVTIFLAFNIYIVICLTVERYISVCVPLMFNTIHTKKKAKIAIIICFAVALVVSLPLFMLKIVCYNDNNQWQTQENTLVTDTTYWHAYIIISEILIRIGPAIVLAILNIFIIRKFRIITQKRKNYFIQPSQQLNTGISSTTPGNGYLRSKKYQEEKRLVILLQAVVILFFITMIPSACLSVLYSDSGETNLHYQIFRAVANLLEIANSALNFCAYFLCSKEFRQGLLNVLTGCCRTTKQESVKKEFSCTEDDLKDSVQTITR